MGIKTGSASDAVLLISALESALGDALPEARLAAFRPLVWTLHPEAEAPLLAGFRREATSDVKAHLLTAAVHLISPLGGTLLEEARCSTDPLLRQTAEYLTNPENVK